MLRHAADPKYAEQRIRFELAETVCPFIPDCERGYCAVLQTSLFAASFFADVHRHPADGKSDPSLLFPQNPVY